MHPQALFADIRDLLACDELRPALEKMRSLLENTPLLNDVLQQPGHLENIQRQLQRRTVTYAETSITQHQIRFGVLELLDAAEKDARSPEALKELWASVGS